MVAAGILDEDERIELIGGEVVPMSPKGNHHEILKAALNEYWVKRLPERFRLVPETTFRLSPDTYLEPDFIFFDRATGIRGLKANTAHFAVEVAGLKLRLRHRAQGRTLREFRHPGALGDPRRAP